MVMRTENYIARACAVTTSLPLAVAVLLLLAAAPAATLFAQPAPAPVATSTPTDSLVSQARALAQRGDTASALALLARATAQSPRDPDALYWRGVVLSRTTGLSITDGPRRILAAHLLNRAADVDARNPRYLLELGRLRLNTPLLRAEADRLFHRALDLAERFGDPVQIADIAAELGQIKTRRYLTGKNRWIYTGPLAFDPLQSQRRLHYTREFLSQLARPIDRSGAVDRIEAEGWFRRALTVVPQHELSLLGLMTLLYDQQRFDEMYALAAPTLAAPSLDAKGNATPVASPRLLLAAALASTKRGRFAQAEQLYTRAIRAFPASLRHDLADIGRILRRGDSVRVAGLNDVDRTRTDSAFWEAADPMLGTPENEARLEFLSRIAFADLFFTDAETHQIGWRTDRGLIAIRYGEAPVIATFAPSTDADAGDALAQVITVWFYPRTETQFVFFGPPAINSASFAGNYRDFAAERREIAPFLVDNVPLALAVDSLPTQVSRFRGPTSRLTELVVATSVNTAHLYRETEIDRGALELSVRVGRAAELRLAKADTVAVPIPARDRLRYLWSDTVRSGDYRLRVEARDPAIRSAVARAHNETTTRMYDSTHVDISDLLIADRISVLNSAAQRWPQLLLAPRGILTMTPRDTFSLYWEVYGLSADAERRAHFDVDITVTILSLDRGNDPVARVLGGLADLVGLSAVGDNQLGLRFERNEPMDGRDRVPQLVTLGLGSAPAGRYRVSVRVTDRGRLYSATSSREFSIAR